VICNASCNKGTNCAPSLYTQRRRLVQVGLRVDSDQVIRVPAQRKITVSAVRLDTSNHEPNSGRLNFLPDFLLPWQKKCMRIHDGCSLGCSLGVLSFAIAPWGSPWALQLLFKTCLASLGHNFGRNSTPSRPQILPSTLQNTMTARALALTCASCDQQEVARTVQFRQKDKVQDH
jgi:hypothetical protein